MQIFHKREEHSKPLIQGRTQTCLCTRAKATWMSYWVFLHLLQRHECKVNHVPEGLTTRGRTTCSHVLNLFRQNHFMQTQERDAKCSCHRCAPFCPVSLNLVRCPLSLEVCRGWQVCGQLNMATTLEQPLPLIWSNPTSWPVFLLGVGGGGVKCQRPGLPSLNLEQDIGLRVCLCFCGCAVESECKLRGMKHTGAEQESCRWTSKYPYHPTAADGEEVVY